MPKETYTLHSTKAFLDLGEAVVKAAAKIRAMEKAGKGAGKKAATVVIPLCSKPDDPFFCVKPPPPPPGGPWGIEIRLVPPPMAGKGVRLPRTGRPRE
jgi:hypothetical protein